VKPRKEKRAKINKKFPPFQSVLQCSLIFFFIPQRSLLEGQAGKNNHHCSFLRSLFPYEGFYKYLNRTSLGGACPYPVERLEIKWNY